VKADPVFYDIKWDAALISIEESINWARNQAHEGAQESRHVEEQSSRKRTWSEDTQEDVDQQIAQEAVNGIIHDTSDPLQLPSSAGQRSKTPVLDREGTPAIRQETPSFGADNNDVWAPQPGEGQTASEHIDPTEALLASLGVSGAPKPVTVVQGAPDGFLATEPPEKQV
jgi:hypothetical protein